MTLLHHPIIKNLHEDLVPNAISVSSEQVISIDSFSQSEEVLPSQTPSEIVSEKEKTKEPKFKKLFQRSFNIVIILFYNAVIPLSIEY